MRYLKTNTATIVTVGPFLDKTDGVTLETALTITNEKISFTVDLNNGSAPTLVLDNVTGATSGTSNDLNYITGNDAGLMQLELSAADTNYLGRAFLIITDAANHCPVFHEFTILPANIYDSMIAGTDLLDVSMTQILGTAVSTPATAGILDVNLKNIANAAVSTSTAQLGVNAVQAGGTAWASGAIVAGAIASGAITNAKFAAGAIDAAAIADNAIDAGSIAADAITAAKIAAGAIDNATFAADVGSTAYATNIIALAADKAIQNAALATASNLAAAKAVVDNIETRLGLPDITIGDDIAAVKAETAAIKAQTDLIPASPAAVGDIPTAVANAAQVRTNLTVELGRIDAAISTRSTYAGGDTSGVTTLLSRIASALTITAGKVDVNDKTGFSLSGAGVQAIWDALTSALTTVGSIGKMLVDRIDAAISSRSTYAGGDTSGVTTLLSRIVGTLAAGTHNAQTGDSFARIGAAGAGLTALGDTRIANLDATVSSRLATAGYTAPPSAAANASQVRSELTVELGRIDATVSSRLATAGYTVPPTASENADANWDEVLSGHLTAGTAGKALSDASAAGTPLDAAGVRAALGMATPNMDAQFNALPTATENADALLDRSNAIDAGLTPRHALELAAASVLQKLTGAGTGTERVRNFSDTADLATVTVDGSGNKNAIIYDFSI